jgi:hypothetical protein
LCRLLRFSETPDMFEALRNNGAGTPLPPTAPTGSKEAALALSARTMLLLLLSAILLAATMALLTGGSGGDIGVVAVGGEERGGADPGLL